MAIITYVLILCLYVICTSHYWWIHSMILWLLVWACVWNTKKCTQLKLLFISRFLVVWYSRHIMGLEIVLETTNYTPGEQIKGFIRLTITVLQQLNGKKYVECFNIKNKHKHHFRNQNKFFGWGTYTLYYNSY